MTPVVVVTNDRELVKKLTLALRDSQARLTTVFGSARAALDAFQQGGQSLAVLDGFLAGSSGLEMLKTLKRLDENCQFVMLTRTRTRSAIERAFRQGAHDVLIYPVETELLRETILRRLAAQPLRDLEEEEEQ